MSRVCRYCRQHFDSVFSLTNYCSNSCSWAATVEEREADDEKKAAEKTRREEREEERERERLEERIADYIDKIESQEHYEKIFDLIKRHRVHGVLADKLERHRVKHGFSASSGESSDKTPISVPELLWGMIVFGFVMYVMFVLPIKAFIDWGNDKCNGVYVDKSAIPAECKNRR